ncbi:Aste57867_3114 [Aphanomyces stellatus]|uniref:Aste57867_3114 protein n=1 Tax=Aphanomyces stellatus TaxID=120398 RepID=A0A485KER6_9STRA|nr:hypothetical protein As57867_003105 [Aphanomyces stellatus]VFT80290.1 Aste57867_3114 [Aphanomyces stellatus]
MVGSASSAIHAPSVVVHVNSIAGKASVCYVESMNVAFDMGVNFLKAACQDHVFITHGHIDHIQALPAHAAERSLTGVKPATYYMPAHLVPHVEQIMANFCEMQESTIPATLVGIHAGATIHISSKVAVKAFPTDHRVASLGYVAYAISKSLKPEYAGLPGRELGALRKQAVEIDDAVWTPMVAYTGDTRIAFFEHENEACHEFLRAHVLCTFMGDASKPSHAEETGHIHLDGLAAIQTRFDNHVLVLTHFSARYSLGYVRETTAAALVALRPTLYVAYGDVASLVPKSDDGATAASDKPIDATLSSTS